MDFGIDGLDVWKRAVSFAVTINKEIIPALPAAEKFALNSQLRRSSQSIAANIAEGHGRYYYQETIRYLYIARGSLTETYNHLVFAQKMAYIDGNTFEKLTGELSEIRKMINGHITFLKSSKKGENEPGNSVRETVTEYEINPMNLYQEDDTTG
ncbi:MAG: four helix bundle protein [Anaerolineae bacterium]|jgi:four helix bundle protein|nr:four helix bundle protein [Anaerolineae bacterium]